MVIRNSKKYICFIVTIFVVFSVIVPFLLFGDLGWLFFVIYEAILLLFLAKFVLTDFRIFVLNEQGITAKLLCFKKRYSWSELKIKRVMSVESKIVGRNSPYKKGVMFSKRAKITALEFIDPNEYSFITLNPFKYIYFNFKPQRGGYGMYEVDEELFFKKMLEWGVELQIDSEFKFIS